jgi:thiol-disulfide isomerase/thioredoxin
MVLCKHTVNWLPFFLFFYSSRLFYFYIALSNIISLIVNLAQSLVSKVNTEGKWKGKGDLNLTTSIEPKWNQLVSSHPHASFGKVNCAEHASYCNSKGVVRFPTIQSNINGGKWHEYTGDYSLNNVNKFIEKINVHLGRNQGGESIELKSSQQLKDIIDSKEPWFVKFYAPWCGHCQHLQPVWVQMAKKLTNKVNVGEVNCEESKALCQEYKIAGLPTLN